MISKPVQFFLLVFTLSVPFWIFGYIATDTNKTLLIKLPISASMTFCSLLVAAILVYKKQKIQGANELLKQAFDFNKNKDKTWFLPIVFLMPTTALLSYWYLKTTSILLPEPQLSLSTIILFLLSILLG